MNRLIALVCLGVIAASANASYELALVLDRTTKKVHRFDAESGAYLGAFGSFSASVTSIKVNPAKGECLVFDSGYGAVFTYDYSSGELKSVSSGWISSLPCVSVNTTNQHWYFPVNTTIYEYTALGTSSIGGHPVSGAASLGDMEWIDSTKAFLGQTGSGTCYVYDFNSNSIVGTTTHSVAMLGVTVLPYTYPDGGSALVGISANGTVYLDKYSGALFQIGSFASGIAAAKDVAALHAGIIAVGKSSGGAAVIQTFGIATTPYQGMFPLITMSGGGITDPVSVATVIAPEPQEWMVLGLGLGALVIRRRRKA